MTKQEQLQQLREEYRHAKTNLDRRLIKAREELIKWSIEDMEKNKKRAAGEEAPSYSEEELDEIFA